MFDYFETDVVQSEKSVQIVGRFLCQAQDIPGRYDRVSQFDQKMKKIIVVTVFNIVKTVMIAMDCRHVLNVCSDLQGYILGGAKGVAVHNPVRSARISQSAFPGKYKTVFLHKFSMLAYMRYPGEGFDGDTGKKRMLGRYEKSGNTGYYRFAGMLARTEKQ